MTRAELFAQIQHKRSFLCIGLDPDPAKLTHHLRQQPDAVYEFCTAIVAATHHLCVAYKPNLAFFEAMGPSGFDVLKRLMATVPNHIFTIADAKRGDIGNTSAKYAEAFFDQMGFDAITLSPYMGHDSITPYHAHAGKWTVILGLTSNPGATDFELMELANGRRVFEEVLHKAAGWGHLDNTMFVVGATRPEILTAVRSVVPDHFLLVPGVGAQGGSLTDVARYGLNNHCGLLVNASRSIIFAGQGPDFAELAAAEAQAMQREMEAILKDAHLI